jgi:RNA polymerase sigma factor (sigma-70 family)
VCWNRAIADDLATTFSADLFLPSSSGASRIASYDGCCPLRPWLRAVIINRAINESGRLRCATGLDKASEGDLVDPAPTPETSVKARRFAEEFEECLASAFAGLSERERAMLFLRYVRELDLAGISHVCGIHQSTVSRSIDRALAKMRGHIRERFPACADVEQPSLDIALNSAEISRVDLMALLGISCGVAGDECFSNIQPKKSRSDRKVS